MRVLTSILLRVLQEVFSFEATIRAMDTTTEFMRGLGINVRRYMLTGGSKVSKVTRGSKVSKVKGKQNND